MSTSGGASFHDARAVGDHQCPRCNGSGWIVDGTGSGPAGGAGILTTIPRSAALLLYAIAAGAGYLVFQRFAASEGIYALLMAILVGVGVLLFEAIIVSVALQPVKAVLVLGIAFGLDQYFLNGAAFTFLRDEVIPWAGGMISFLISGPR